MHSAPAPRHGFVSIGTLVLVVVALICAVLVGTRVSSARAASDLAGRLRVNHGTVAGSDTAPTVAPTAQQTLGTATVRDLAGKIVPLVTPGEPTVVMISSRTCSWCKKALKDFGEMANGRAIPRLTLLTLEGASEGTAMLQKEKLTGARLVGPVTNREETLLSLRFAGTPVFVAVDKNGRVLHTIPGYPIRPELERMFAVMVGDADAP